MLIDLYERPYSPEASKSRAFIDRILALSGPDGGVVGGEDGISTQRPLKDGGREAWDMIRRLRQKAWQKAGLNPEVLWTEQDQIQAGIIAQADESRHRLGQVFPGSSPVSISPASAMSQRQPSSPDPQLADFNRMFYNMTRNHILSNSLVSGAMRPSLLRYSYKAPTQTTNSLPLPNYNPVPAAATMPTTTISPPMVASSPDKPSPLESSSPFSSSAIPSQPPGHSIVQPLETITPITTYDPSRVPFRDPVSPNPRQSGVPTPPSMVDPNLNFDWDQWDAVFGQHLPVADELMELDPAIGLEFANFGVPTMDLHESNIDPSGMPATTNIRDWYRS